jgi:Domain of unknown function (DUF6851)
MTNSHIFYSLVIFGKCGYISHTLPFSPNNINTKVPTMHSRNFILLATAMAFRLAAMGTSPVSASAQTAVVRWDAAAVQGVRDATPGPPMVARALAIVHTCMFDAWAAFDRKAIGTQLGGSLRRPAAERTEANKQKAISYAAYRALLDL